MGAAVFHSQVLIDKFYPPRSGAARILYRRRLIEHLLRCGGSPFPTIVIEGRAGQGKTTLIQQFLSAFGAASAWYQVGPEDADPVLFLQTIFACLHSRLPNFPSAATVKLLEGELGLFDLPKCLNLLVDDLDAFLQEDLYLVFDDLHYLTSHEASLQLLSGLLDTVLPRLHFVFSSREPLSFTNGLESAGKRHLCRIGNEDLALTEDEITDLFHQVFDLDIDNETCHRIFHFTDGWVMGVNLLALQMVRRPGDPGQLPGHFGRQDLQHYFRKEILSSLETKLHLPLMILSLLESIPVNLAIELTGHDAIGRDLALLARRNHFVRHLDTDNTLFGLHHLFKKFLQERVRKELDPEAVRAIYRQAGEFCLQQHRTVQALRYLLQSDAWERIDNLLRDEGVTLLATNQTDILTQLLRQVPASYRMNYGWISFYLALARLDSAPGEALPLLNQALMLFAARRDQVGELLSLSHIVSIHITTTGHYRAGERFLDRATELFYQMTDTLDAHQTILVARSLAMGHAIFHADIEQSTKFATLALNLARREAQPNFEAALLMVKGYIHIFAGHTGQARIYMEEAAPYVYRPDIGSFNKLAIRMMLFNFLFHDGDFANYFDQKDQFIDVVGNEMASQSIAGPFCHVWEMDIAINRGRFEEALALADRALLTQPPLSPHLRGLVLQLQGLVLAMQGKPQSALDAAMESERLRELSGGAYFITLNKLLVGLINAHCGDRDRALELLDEGIEAARQMPTEYLEACGLLHRASVLLGRNEKQQAVEDIVYGLRLMRQNGYRYFWGWSPAAMADIFSLAVAERIEPGYVRRLAAERLDCAILDDRRLIPLLQIETLGHFRIRQSGTLLLDTEDLTPTQRELICMLVATPGFKLPVETIQLHFWPESPAKTAARALDTLVSRLRKTLNQALAGQSAQCYLQRKRGMLLLSHCRVDACEFLTAVKRGLQHRRLQENWQASNAFTIAESLWQGDFAPGIAGEGQVRTMRGDLCRALADLTHAWSGLLVVTERLPRAITLVEKALRCDPLNDRLHALRYRLCGRISAIRARQVVHDFKHLLEGEDYPADEIAELLNLITTELSPS